MSSLDPRLQARLDAFINFKVKHPHLEEMDQDLKRFQESGVKLVECPNCASTRTLSPRKGILRFPSHNKRKTRTPNTDQRWAMKVTDN